jgi:hypothetical protein
MCGKGPGHIDRGLFLVCCRDNARLERSQPGYNRAGIERYESERMAWLIIGHSDQKGSTGRSNRIVRRNRRCGSCAPALGGAIFLRCSAIRAVRFATSAGGAAKGSGGKFRGDGHDPHFESDFRFHCGPSPLTRGRPKKGIEDPAIGRSRCGRNTKIHMAVRGSDCPERFTLTAGKRAMYRMLPLDRRPARKAHQGRDRLRCRCPAPGDHR